MNYRCKAARDCSCTMWDFGRVNSNCIELDCLDLVEVQDSPSYDCKSESNKPARVLKVTYGREGKPISDFEVYDYVDMIINSYNACADWGETVKTSSELCFMTFGLRALEEKIPLNEIEFYYEDEKLNFDPIRGIEYPESGKFGFMAEVTKSALEIALEKIMNEKKGA